MTTLDDFASLVRAPSAAPCMPERVRALDESLAPRCEAAWNDPRVAGLRHGPCEAELKRCGLVAADKRTWDRLYTIAISEAVTGRDAFDALHFAPVVFLAAPAGRFEFAHNVDDAAGHRVAIIIPCRDQWSVLADLAAFDLETGGVALWRADVAMLGEDNILASRMGAPLKVHETAADWLRVGRDGVVIVDWRKAASRLEGVSLEVSSLSFGEAIEARLHRPAPPIFVNRALKVAA